MNERIEKISEQARQYAWENETHWSANAEREALFEQKFAELIVKECSYLADQAHYKATNGKSASGYIRQQFGVEE